MDSSSLLGGAEFGCEFHVFWPHLIPLGSIELAVLEMDSSSLLGGGAEFGCEFHVFWPHMVPLGSIELQSGEKFECIYTCCA
jgi:hypothetical protein